MIASSPSFLEIIFICFSIDHPIPDTMGAAGGWINKEALASVPPSILGARIWLTAIWASYCGALHGFNSANINGIMNMKAFKEDFGIDEMDTVEASNTTGWVTSAMLLVSLSMPRRKYTADNLSRVN